MTALGELLTALRIALVDEASPQSGQQLAYGRPHQHPRARWFPRYSKTGERLPGAERIGPDCPRPVKGRCECPPDGSWRPAVGVVRADATARHAVAVPASRLRSWLDATTVWVDEVYDRGTDGLWRCRWPVRRALERLRGASPRRWAIAVAVLRGDALASVWGSHGAPPDPAAEALRILGQLERWADEERWAEWERRPRQWWDRRQPNGRSFSLSESQAIAEHGPSAVALDSAASGAATLAPTGRVRPLPRSAVSDAAQPEQPSGQSGARGIVAYSRPLDQEAAGA
jgi:hypothetical protein